jgi:hypothetical protein
LHGPGSDPGTTRRRSGAAERGWNLNTAQRPAPGPARTRDPQRRRGTAPRGRASAGGLLFLVAFGLLLGAYVFSNPPGAASDEPSHLVKAAALSIGEVRGDPVRYRQIGAWSDARVEWLSRTSRILRVPPGYAGCEGFTVPSGGSCTDPTAVLDRPLPPVAAVSYVATYPVPAYLPAALGIRLASALGAGPTAGLLLARAAGAVAAGVFAAGAVRLLRRGGRADLPVLAGAALVLTPMVVFTCSQVSGSGLELTSGLCFGAGLLRLARPALGDLSARAAWAWTGVSGVVLATARTLGPMWLVVAIGVVLALRGGRLAGAVRMAPRPAAAAIGALLAGTALSLTWQAVVEPHPRTSLGITLANLPAAVRGMLGVADMYVGRLGWIGIRLPLLLVVGWLLLTAVLVGLAARLGTRRERAALTFSVVVAVGVTVFVAAYAILATAPDFVMQARYVMPALSMVPLVAVDILRGHAHEGWRRWGPRPDGVAAGVLGWVTLAQVVAFTTNVAAHRAAWRPPLGWTTWTWAVAVAALASLAATVRMLRADRPPAVAVALLRPPPVPRTAVAERPVPVVADPLATGGVRAR